MKENKKKIQKETKQKSMKNLNPNPQNGSGEMDLLQLPLNNEDLTYLAREENADSPSISIGM